jgi:hypothetical protein
MTHGNVLSVWERLCGCECPKSLRMKKPAGPVVSYRPEHSASATSAREPSLPPNRLQTLACAHRWRQRK